MSSERLPEKETVLQLFARRILKKYSVGSKEYQDLIEDVVWFQDIESALGSDDFNEQTRGRQAIQTESGNARHKRLITEYGMGQLTPDELKELIKTLKEKTT